MEEHLVPDLPSPLHPCTPFGDLHLTPTPVAYQQDGISVIPGRVSQGVNCRLEQGCYLALISARCLSTRSVLGCMTILPRILEMPVLNVLSNPGS